MRTSTKLIRLCSVVPASLAGSFLAVMGLGFLPDVGLVFAFLGTLLLSLVLVCGWWEAPAVRLFGFARGLRPGERAVLQPALALVETLNLAPGRVLVRLAVGDGLPATPSGRDTVVVEQWLLDGLYERRLRAEDAAAAIGHAVASQRVGPCRFDMAARLWAFPWTLMFVVIRQIARVFSWVPAGGFAWHLRIVIGVVAVVQGFQPGGNPTIGVGVGVLVAISYVAPAADRTWRAVVERDADRVVAQGGLADPLIHFAQWRQGTGSMERVHRIRSAASDRALSTPPETAQAPAPDHAPGARVLRLVTAHR